MVTVMKVVYSVPIGHLAVGVTVDIGSGECLCFPHLDSLVDLSDLANHGMPLLPPAFLLLLCMFCNIFGAECISLAIL